MRLTVARRNGLGKRLILMGAMVFSLLCGATVTPTIEVRGKVVSFDSEVVRLKQKNTYVDVARILVPKSQKLVVGQIITIKVKAKLND